MSTEIRLLGPGDEATLQNIHPDVFDLPVRDGLVREFLEDPRHHLAAAIEGRVVGFASAVHYVHPDKDPELWINEVEVAPDHRGRGLGKELLRALLVLAAELGCGEAWVLTEPDNAAAIGLYRSLGGVRARTDSVMFSFIPGSAGDMAGTDPGTA
jgi:ribosomal protein S18 acetylase RimI-like enzyme